jgi:uncharacterized membrane protein
MSWLGLSIGIFLIALYTSSPKVFLSNPLKLLSITALIFLAIAWNISPEFPGQEPGKFYGLIFHFYGASLLTAMFGPSIALVILFPVALLGIYAVQGNIMEASQQYFFVCAVPVAFSYLSILLIKKFIPKHLFILILGNGYVAAFASTIFSGIALLVAQQLLGHISNNFDFEGWLLALIIIAFMEGSLSGMLLAIFLIFRPHWVATYNEESYMNR